MTLPSNAARRLTEAAILAVAVTIAPSCRQDSKIGVTANINPETTPTMLTRDVETLISDSGITRYRIVTPLWLIYDEAKVPFWRFPDGLKLEQFNNFLQRHATVECDSAQYLKDARIWRLDGHVKIETITKERFLTNQLFWDQRQRKIYSDSFIRVERPDRTLEGYGFTANERLTSYDIRRVSGIFPANALKQPASAAPSQPTSPTPPQTTSQTPTAKTN